MRIYRGCAVDARLNAERIVGEAEAKSTVQPGGPPWGPLVWHLASPHREPVSAVMDTEGYEAWVAGYVVDPTGVTQVPAGPSKGHLRSGPRRVRLLEIDVNGPKTWSLAAALHPEVAGAYRAAQGRAAADIVRWLTENAVSRVGPQGGQIAVPVEEIEAVTMQRSLSRAGDPHECLRLQANARVRAAGQWRGLHTGEVIHCLRAINGIGHAAVMADPGLRGSLAGRGYTVDLSDGEIHQVAPFAAAYSKRQHAIAAGVARRELAWRKRHPDATPSDRLRRAWDDWACDDTRQRVEAAGSETASARNWHDELKALGFQAPDRPSHPAVVRVEHLDQAAVLELASGRLEKGRRPNAANVRGEVERACCQAGLVADPVVRWDLAQQLTERLALELVELRGTG